MAVQVKIPSLGESVTEAVLGTWLAQEGQTVAVDEIIFELESDKANMEIAAEAGGMLHILKQEGDTVAEGDVVAEIDTAAEAAAPPAATKADPAPSPSKEPAPVTPPREPAADAPEEDGPFLSPAVRRIVHEENLDPTTLPATGPGNRITKADALQAAQKSAEAPSAPPPSAPDASPAAAGVAATPRTERRVRMSRMRQIIARRMVDAQRTAAILTTFNEVDLSQVMALRAEHKEAFREKHDVGLGFMSFFAKACCAAARNVPELNAEIQDDEIVYRDGVNMGIAVGTPKGLVVPVVRDCDLLSFAGIEKEIARLAAKGRDGKLGVGDLSGATFTISNGGVYGSLLSTPILNPPQSGILGMHKIEKRPIVVDDAIVIRPMMYLALSYDHRIVDGEGAVTFLVRVKEALEAPAKLLLEI
jgi:2-oxoglutarate dehydrogenase E2 component (dihydrolipoamide succinyltransferase)